MNKPNLFCVDCYENNQELLTVKCLEKCDGHGPVDTSERIKKRRIKRAKNEN